MTGTITPIGVGTATLYSKLTTAGSGVDMLVAPGDTNAPIIFEPPPGLSAGDFEIWLIASGAFALYIANFSSYNKTYGSLAAIVIFLVWLWISNVAILLGAELNAELERERRLAAGQPAEREPFVEPRDTRKMQRA